LILLRPSGTSSKGGYDAVGLRCRRISSFGGGARRAEEDFKNKIQ